MFKRILVALDHTDTDRFLIPKIEQLARLSGSELLLVHVADGWAARHYEQLKLSDSEEIKEDRAYLEQLAVGFREKGLSATTLLAMGDPPSELLRAAKDQECDLIAMTSHGHRLVGDVLHGETIEQVRHRATIPMFIVSAKSDFRS